MLTNFSPVWMSALIKTKGGPKPMRSSGILKAFMDDDEEK